MLNLYAVLGLGALAVTACPQEAHNPRIIYPEARRRIRFVSTWDADPYSWLEEVDSVETKTWVEAENKLTSKLSAYINKHIEP